MAPIYGSLMHLIGRRQTFMISISIFFVGTALCSIATNMKSMIAARAIAGLGASGLVPGESFRIVLSSKLTISRYHHLQRCDAPQIPRPG